MLIHFLNPLALKHFVGGLKIKSLSLFRRIISTFFFIHKARSTLEGLKKTFKISCDFFQAKWAESIKRFLKSSEFKSLKVFGLIAHLHAWYLGEKNL